LKTVKYILTPGF